MTLAAAQHGIIQLQDPPDVFHVKRAVFHVKRPVIQARLQRLSLREGAQLALQHAIYRKVRLQARRSLALLHPVYRKVRLQAKPCRAFLRSR